MPRREKHTSTRVLTRGAATLSGVAILLFSGNAVASARMAPPAGSASPHEVGARIAVPANPLLTLAIADWTTRARATGDSSSSFSRAALVDLRIGGDETSRDGVLSVAVLEAVSAARWTGAASHGDGENNGV